MNRETAIAWTNLTFEVTSLLTRKKRTILKSLNGFASFGTLNAVMGPSGAGLTSLMKCLNGMNNSDLSSSTKILLNNNLKIRSSFVANNEKDFLILGLTAKQNLIYASKLKNSREDNVDHENNVMQIMSQLMIEDTVNTKAGSCSGGQQKRLAIALELTAIRKPNLIFCDEPTTGLDSNVAEVVVNCLKQLVVQQNICLVITIHQPNSDIMDMFDNMYVLSKGGQCVFSGLPKDLVHTMADSDIICGENQVPIETLITIGSKGSEDNRIAEMRLKTARQVYNLIQSRNNHLRPKFIKQSNKRFNVKDVYLLLERSVVEFIHYNYVSCIIRFLAIVLSTTIITFTFDPDIGKYNDCIDLKANETKGMSCIEVMDKDYLVAENVNFIGMSCWVLSVIQTMVTINEKIVRLKIFKNEHQNKWYSSAAYYWTESIADFMWVTITSTLSVLIMFYRTHQKDEANRFFGFFYGFQMMMHYIDGAAHLIAILLLEYQELSYLVGLLFSISLALNSNMGIAYEEMPEAFKPIVRASSFYYGLDAMYISIYGFDRCEEGLTSETLYKLELTDDEDMFVEQTCYGLGFAILVRVLCLIALLILKNRAALMGIKDRFDEYRKRNRSKNVYHLNTISNYIMPYDGYIQEVDISDEMVRDLNGKTTRQSSDSTVQIDLREETEAKRPLSIAWIDMTLKVDKTFYSEEKLILRGIKGFIRFGTMTALMGPSGAGKTSLLRCLNGMYRDMMTKDSKIYLSKTNKIRTCFIAQDQREHIVPGLTVNQALLYASKLKNSGKSVNHRTTINDLMEELAINDIKNNSVDGCSSGQQKRVVMAMEMTSIIKPNLICVDEPTSGVDSHSALLMVQCFRSIAQKHNLTIIISIHQPTLETLMNFDQLYVLAKGGVCMYSGRPQHLRQHMTECQITIRENQIPIEVLLKVGANGYNDQSVIQLAEKATKVMTERDEKNVMNDLKLFPNGIPIRSKRVSLAEMWYLFIRVMICIVRRNWLIIAFQFVMGLLGLGYFIIIADFDYENHFGCVPKVADSCPKNEQIIKDNKIIMYNLKFMMLTFIFFMCLTLCMISILFAKELDVFMKEYRNSWYSVESYFVVKSVIDLVPNITLMIIAASLTYILYSEFDDAFPALILMLCLGSLISQSLGHIYAIIFGQRAIVVAILTTAWMVLFAGVFVTDRDLGDFIEDTMLGTDPCKHNIAHMAVLFYGFGRCPEGFISPVMYKFKYDDDDFDDSTLMLVYEMIFLRVLSYVCLKVKVNWHIVEILFKNVKTKLFYSN